MILGDISTMGGTVLAATWDGGVLRSEAGSDSWVFQWSPSLKSILNAIDASSQGIWVVVGWEGIWRSTDDGVSWEKVHTADYVNTVSFAGSSVAIAAGNDGDFYRSVDGGLTWQQVDIGVTERLNDSDFFDADLGMIVGESGTVMRTMDGGQNWSPMEIGTDMSLRSLSFLSASSAVIVGESSVFRTEDDGATWTEVELELDSQLHNVSFRNERDGIITAYNAAYTTQDGGETWMELDLPVGDLGNAIPTVDGDGWRVIGLRGDILRLGPVQ